MNLIEHFEDKVVAATAATPLDEMTDIGIIAIALCSIAISQKRQADSMDRLEAKPIPSLQELLGDLYQ